MKTRRAEGDTDSIFAELWLLKPDAPGMKRASIQPYDRNGEVDWGPTDGWSCGAYFSSSRIPSRTGINDSPLSAPFFVCEETRTVDDLLEAGGPPVAVPEPGFIWMALAGVIALAWLGRARL